MVDQAAESVGPVAGDPIDHVATIRSSESGNAVAIHPGIAGKRSRQALLQIHQRLAAPIVGDGISERLAVANRAVEIDHHHRVAGTGVGLGVPAIVEVVAEGPLRTAVDQEGDRVALSRIEVDRLEDIRVHRLVVPTVERELLGLAHLCHGHLGVIEVSNAKAIAAVHLDAVELHRRAQMVEAIDQPAVTLGYRPHRTLFDHRPYPTAGDVNGKERALPQIGRHSVDRGAIRRPHDIAGRAIPLFGQYSSVAARPGSQHDTLTIGLEAGTRHGQIGQGLAVRREDRRRVPGLIRFRQAARRFRTVGRAQIEIEIRRPRLFPSGIASSEHDTPTVRGEGVFLRAAERL